MLYMLYWGVVHGLVYLIVMCNRFLVVCQVKFCGFSSAISAPKGQLPRQWQGIALCEPNVTRTSARRGGCRCQAVTNSQSLAATTLGCAVSLWYSAWWRVYISLDTVRLQAHLKETWSVLCIWAVLLATHLSCRLKPCMFRFSHNNFTSRLLRTRTRT
jgi:hypothetical protein